MVLFCVAQRHSVVIMNTEQCPSVANHPIKRGRIIYRQTGIDKEVFVNERVL